MKNGVFWDVMPCVSTSQKMPFFKLLSRLSGNGFQCQRSLNFHVQDSVSSLAVPHCSSQNHKVKVVLRPMVSRPVCPGIRPPSGTCDQFLFTSVENIFRRPDSSRGPPSLMRGRVCNLHAQVLLGLASAVTLRPKSCRTCDQIFLSHLRLVSLSVTSYDSQGDKDRRATDVSRN
jgi:hypothetical protein